MKSGLIHHPRWRLSVLVVWLINMPKPSSTHRRTRAPSAQWESVQPDSDTDLQLCTAPQQLILLLGKPHYSLTVTTIPASVACRHWWHKHVNFTWQWMILSQPECVPRRPSSAQEIKSRAAICTETPAEAALPHFLLCSLALTAGRHKWKEKQWERKLGRDRLEAEGRSKRSDSADRIHDEKRLHN